MLLGFSLAPMLPMLVNGLKARDALFPGVEDWMAGAFAEHVAAAGDRIKAQTIRAFDGNLRSPYSRLKPGDRLDLWWKPRTGQRHKLGEAPCASVRRVVLDVACWTRLETATGSANIKVLNRHQTWTEVLQPDGFDTPRDAEHFFYRKPGSAKFHGVVVGW